MAWTTISQKDDDEVRARITTGKFNRTTPAEPMIPVLAQESDQTADGVVLGLVERGEPVVRVDLSWFPQRLTLDTV